MITIQSTSFFMPSIHIPCIFHAASLNKTAAVVSMHRFPPIKTGDVRGHETDNVKQARKYNKWHGQFVEQT
jgi:hypothetical protein